MNREELIKALREDAEWASSNEWESPIALGDNLTDAADLLENDQKRLDVLNDYTIQLENQKESLLAENERLCGKEA